VTATGAGDEEGVPGMRRENRTGSGAGKSNHQRMPLGRFHRPNPDNRAWVNLSHHTSFKPALKSGEQSPSQKRPQWKAIDSLECRPVARSAPVAAWHGLPHHARTHGLSPLAFIQSQ